MERTRPPVDTDDRSGCSFLGLTLVLLCAVLAAVGWVSWHTVYFTSVGPPPGIFGFFLFVLAVLVGMVACVLWLRRARPSDQARWIVAVGTALVLGAGFVLSCAPWQDLKTYFGAEIVGVVASSEYDPAGVERVLLGDGRVIELKVPAQSNGSPGAAGRYLTLPGKEWRSGARAGDLLLAGESPSPWYTTAYPSGETCYRLETTGIERPNTIDLESGLRLARAPDFPAGGDLGPFSGWPCLDAQGRVTSIMGLY